MIRRSTIVIGLLLLIIGMAGMLTYRVIYTEPGLRMLLAAVQSLEAVRIETGGARGTLAGPFFADTIVIDHPAVHVEARGLAGNPDLRSLLSGKLTIDGLRIEAIEVVLKPVDQKARTDPHFMPRLLSISLPSFEIRNAGLRLVNQKRLEVARIDGQLNVSHSLLTLSRAVLDDPAGHLEGDIALRATEPLGLQGRLEGRWQLPDQKIYAFKAGLGGDLKQLATEITLSEPATLAFSGNLLTLTSTPSLAGTVRAVDFDGTPWVPAGRIPAISGSLAIAASGRSIGVDGTLASPLFGDGQLRVQGSGRLIGPRLEIAGLRIWLPRLASELIAWGEIGFGESSPSLALSGEWTALRWPLSGESVVESPWGSYELNGASPYDFKAEVVVSGAGIENAHAQGSGRIEPTAISIHDVAAELLDGHATASGELSWEGEGRWRAELAGKSLDIGRVRPDLQGRVSFAATLEGSGLTAASPWSARIDELSGILQGRNLRGRGSIRHRAGTYDLNDILVSSGGSTLNIAGRWGTTVDLDWRVDLRTLSLLSPDLDGQLESSGTIHGRPSRPEIKGNLRAREVSYGTLRAGSIDANLDLDLADSRDSRVEVVAGDGAAGSIAIESINLKSVGRLAAHQIDLTLKSPGTTDGRFLGFRAAMAADGEADLEARTWKGNLQSFQAIFSDGSAELIQPVAIKLSADGTSVAPLCLETGEARLCAEGEWHRAPESWRAIYSAQDWPLKRLLRSMLGWKEFDGRLQASGWIAKDPGQDWIGGTTLLLDDPTLDIPRNKFRSERVSLGQGRLDLFAEPEQIRTILDLHVTEGTQLTGSAFAERRPGRPLALAPLRGELRGESSALNALPLFVPEIDRSTGRLDARLTLGGTLGDPTVNGRFRIDEGEFELYRTNLVLSGVVIDGVLSGDELDFNGLGETPEGSMNLSGHFRWPNGVMTGRLHLKGDRLLLADTPEFRVLASPDLVLYADAGEYRIEGDVLLPEAMISPRDLSTSIGTSSDEHVVGLDEDDRGPSTMERVSSKIRVILGDKVRVDSRGLEARLGGEVTILTTPGNPARGKGSINLLEGQYNAFGQDVKITRGKLIYRNTPLSDPDIDLVAEREIRNEDVTVAVNVRGRLAEPYITITSSPAMPGNEALSYLLTGRSIDALQSNEASSVNSAANDLAISGGSLLLGGLGRRVGIDEVYLERSGDKDAEVVLGKFLSPRLFVSYGISVVEAINTIKLRYTINRNWSANVEAGINQSADIEYKIEH